MSEWHLLTDDEWHAVVFHATVSEPAPNRRIASLVDRYRREHDRADHAGSYTPEQRRRDALERIAADIAYTELIDRRESGEPVPVSTDTPLVDPDDARLLGTANGAVPDSFSARDHVISARTGLVVKRGRAAITGGLGHWAVPYIDGYLSDEIDVDALERDSRGRTQSIALAALATRLYGLDELVGTDAMSWEQLVDANGADVVATMVTPAVLVSHRNPSDPMAALIDYIGHERVSARRRSPNVDSSVFDAVGDMCSHTVYRRPSTKRWGNRYRLQTIRRRTGDPEPTGSALLGSHDRVVIRRRLSDIRTLVSGEPDRVVVGTAPASHVWAGHRLVRRPQSRRVIQSRRATVKRDQVEEITIHAVASRVDALGYSTSTRLNVDGYAVQISRTARGLFNMRVTTPTGMTLKRGNKSKSAHVVAAIAHIQRVESDRVKRLPTE
jgi:hypothetical protein